MLARLFAQRVEVEVLLANQFKMTLWRVPMLSFPKVSPWLEYEPLIEASKTLSGRNLHPSAYWMCAYGATQAGLVQRQFRKQAKSYDDTAQNAPEVLDWVAQNLSLSKDMHVLDNCTGTGLVARRIAGEVSKVTATDVSSHMLDVGRAKAAAANQENIEFQQTDAAQLPYQDGQFDAVVSRLSLNYFEDPSAALREMVRVCKPGGQVAIVERVSPADLEERLRERLDFLENCRDPAHRRFVSAKDLIQMMQAERLSVSQTNPAQVCAGVQAAHNVEQSLEEYVESTKTVQPNVQLIRYALEGNVNFPNGDHDQITGLLPSKGDKGLTVTQAHVIAVGLKQ